MSVTFVKEFESYVLSDYNKEVLENLMDSDSKEYIGILEEVKNI
jgi:hypothetical protein